MARGRHTALRITLTEKIPARQAHRGRMLVLLAEGMTVTEIAQRVGVTRRFVSMWARRFQQHGIEGLADKPGRGQRPRLHQQDRI